MKVQILGIDLAKNVFQLDGVDRQGRAVLARRLRREQLLKVLGELEPCLIGIEASTGVFFWHRQFEKLGHTVRIMAPQYVKPFVTAPEERYERRRSHLHGGAAPEHAVRTEEDARTAGHPGASRARQRLVNHRTALISQMRGLLLDRGIAIAVSATRARRLIPKILAAPSDELTGLMREIVSSL